MKIGNLVKVYLNNHDEPAPRRVYPGIIREAHGTIVSSHTDVYDVTEFEVLVEGKLVWFYSDEVRAAVS